MEGEEDAKVKLKVWLICDGPGGLLAPPYPTSVCVCVCVSKPLQWEKSLTGAGKQLSSFWILLLTATFWPFFPFIFFEREKDSFNS